MRLYLSSFLLGNHPEELAKMAGDNKRVAIIANAGDMGTPEMRLKIFDRDTGFMRSLGFEPEEVDLRAYFGKQDALAQHMNQFGIVWVRGGNVFVLKRAYEQSGFDAVISNRIKEDSIVYSGYSAGVCILAPTLKGIDLCDPVDVVPPGYASEFSWNGLDIIPYSILPHYKSDHPETEMIDEVVAYAEKNNIPFKTLRDGQAIVRNKGQEYIVG